MRLEAGASSSRAPVSSCYRRVEGGASSFRARQLLLQEVEGRSVLLQSSSQVLLQEVGGWSVLLQTSSQLVLQEVGGCNVLLVRGHALPVLLPRQHGHPADQPGDTLKELTALLSGHLLHQVDTWANIVS